MIESTSPSKIRKLNPAILKPPIQVIAKQKKKIFEGKMKNPVFRFFIIFFGEGF